MAVVSDKSLIDAPGSSAFPMPIMREYVVHEIENVAGHGTTSTPRELIEIKSPFLMMMRSRR